MDRASRAGIRRDLPVALGSVLLLSFCWSCGLLAGDNELTEKERREGWILLFDGKTLAG